MDRMIYTAMSGLRGAMAQQRVTANNLANASTVGFRRDVGSFQSRYVAGTTFDSRVHATDQVLAAKMEPGALIATGQSMDVAMNDGAMLAVQASDGSEAYTRRGDLRLNAAGVLETGEGTPVIGQNGPITLPPAAKVEIGPDGTISVQPQGAPETEMVAVDRLKLVEPDFARIKKGDDGLFRSTDGQLAQSPAASLQSGSLEQSNVNSVAAMVDMLEAARGFELQVKMLSTAGDLDQSSMQLMRLE